MFSFMRKFRRGRKLMLALLAAVVMLLVGTGILFAQDQPDACTQVVSLSDVTCSTGDCISPDNCTSRTFRCTCPGPFKMVAKTICSGGVNCANCQACVNVYDDQGNLVVNCHVTGCLGGECNYVCGDEFTLESGQNYTLYVCLIPCTGHDCNDCPSTTCKAYGCIYTQYAVCPSP